MIPAAAQVESQTPDGYQTSSGPLEAVLGLVLDSVTGLETKRAYARGLIDFTSWRGSQGFTRATVQAWRASLEAQELAPATINLRLAAVRKLAREASANGLLDAAVAASIESVAGIRQRGTRTGNWLTLAQAQALIQAPKPETLHGKRDRCALAVLVGCALRRGEASRLCFEDIQQREARWVIVDLKGKGGRLRTVPVPDWVKRAIDDWGRAAQLTGGRVLRSLKSGLLGESLSEPVIWKLAAHYGETIGVTLQAHDLRRTCAKLCRAAGGELEQIQLLLGHASVQTTERYLGTKQDLVNAPNDRLGLKWRDA